MSHDEIKFSKIMREQGYRVTPQRLLILDAVCEGGGHTTFGEIYLRVKEADPLIDQSTVYRTLDLLCEVGVIVSADIGDEGKVYEIAKPTPHHHLVCQVCGNEQELDGDMMQALFEQIKREQGFMVQTDHLVLSGVCRRCGEDAVN